MEKESVSISNMYRNLFARIKGLLTSPRKEWNIIFNDNMGVNEVLSQYTLPLLALYSVTFFVGQLVGVNELNFEYALKNTAFGFSAYFFGLYLGYHILYRLMILIRQPMEKSTVFKLVAFPSGVLYIVSAIAGLFTEMILIRYLVNVYIIYIVWVSVIELGAENNESRVINTFSVSAIILFAPYMVSKLLYFVSELLV